MVESLITAALRWSIALGCLRRGVLSLLSLGALVASSAHAAVPTGYNPEDRIELEGGIHFLGASLESGVPIGGEIHLELVYQVTSPLPVDVYSFVHFESMGSDCRIVDDRRAPMPDGGAAGGIIRHALVVRVPTGKASCEGATLELYTGLYDRKTGVRTAATKPTFLDDRMHAGYIELLPAGEALEPVRVLTPSEMSGRAFWSRVKPWYGWLAGIALAVLLTWYVARRRRRAPLQPPDAAFVTPMAQRDRRIRAVGYLIVLGLPLVLSMLAGLDYIKDDAYISFRYTHNLVAGHGLVFNPGERVEGITNFLWTVLMVPFEAMGWDLFIMSEILGLALWAGILLYLVRMSKLFTTSDGSSETVRSAAILWGGVWLATSSSMAKWSHSGMEQALAMFLPMLAAWLLWRPLPEGRPDGDGDGNNNKGAFWSGIFMGLGCATRPEIHFIGICLGLPLVIRIVRERKIPRATLLWFAGLLLITVPFHGIRYAYYGSIVPNTFYVKTGDSSLVWLTGLQKLHEMFGFNATGALAVLAPFAFMARQRLTEKLVALAVTLGYMAFLVKVGVDEMEWHRLYLPALPFLVLLAAVGLMNLCSAVAGVLPISGRRIVAFGIGWVAVVVAASANFSFTYTSMGGFNGRGDLSGNYHPDLGKFITRHDRERALVAFQDMGSTPYHAPDIDFLDFIGLVDATVARARYSYGLHAFMATESSKRQPEFDADMRKYFYSRNPEWTILTTYIPDGAMSDTANRFAADPGPRALMPYLKQNGYQFGITDERFDASYVHVRTWVRSAGYYLSLYRRKDLWDQTPGEVVLDAPPAAMAGVKATLEGGLELIGSEIQPTSKSRYEAFFTTWWRVPGPMDPDTYIFFHVERPESPDHKAYRQPFDTVPGDWMYPADRWKAGQIIEHRVLFQVPWDMPLGDFKVMMGVYRKRSGHRLKVTQGPNDGQDRLELGPLTITPLNPPWDELIPRTVPSLQRKHPERIIDSGRRHDPSE